jgi:hypothetical protein
MRSPVPEGQDVCSMCYGDPYYGNDGYYLEWLRQQEEQEIAPPEDSDEFIKTPNG